MAEDGQVVSSTLSRGRLTGVISSLGAALSYALAALCVKLCSVDFSLIVVLWTRGIIGIFLVAAPFAWHCESPWGPRHLRGWLALRGMLGVASVVAYFVAIVSMPIADAISLYSMKPVFATLLGALLLKEPLKCVHGWACVASLTGCIVVAHGKGHHADSNLHSVPDSRYLPRAIASVITLLGALGSAATSVVTRRIMSRSAVGALVPVWYFYSCDMVVLACLSPLLLGTKFVEQKPDWSWLSAVALAGVGIFSMLGQQTMTVGLRYVPSALGTILVQTETVYVFVLQGLVYRDVSAWSISGAVLICAATTALARNELRSEAAQTMANQAGTQSPPPCSEEDDQQFNTTYGNSEVLPSAGVHNHEADTVQFLA